MILTVALNPVVIREIELEAMQIDGSNQSVSESLAIGDCGIYSAHIMRLLQGDPYVIGFSGGISGRFIKNFLDKNRIKSDFVVLDQETKSILRIDDTIHQTTTEIVNDSIHLKDHDFKNYKHKFHNHVHDCEVVVITSDSKSDATLDILEDTLAMAKNSRKVVVSAEGIVLDAVVEHGPYAVVVEGTDLPFAGVYDIDNEQHLEKVRLWMIDKGIHFVFVIEKNRITGFTKNKIVRIGYFSKDMNYPIIKSGVVGGVAMGIHRSEPLEKICKTLGAIADQISIANFPKVIKRKEIDRGLNHVKVEELYNHRNGYVIGENL